ncbi:MAG: DNA-binding response OmpR family regulator [Planctomycetota bacterium]|jgi:DNA-binding response OmpR family regulator
MIDDYMGTHATVPATKRRINLARPKEILTAKLLLIEDDEYLVASLSRDFYRAGFSVEAARDGVLGLQRALTGDPDVVVLDLGLPRMRGRKVLHELRSQKPWLPIVVITGDRSMEVEEWAASSGVQALLQKPCSINLMIKTIKRILKDK